jgi:hypothetical protein
MAGSAADAIGQAVERSKQLLFPFKAEKWFALGFTVFLAQCGEGNFNSGQSTNVPFRGGSSLPRGSGLGLGTDLQRIVTDAIKAFDAEVVFYVTLAIVLVVVALGISALVLWVSSRAKLMFVESVIWDRVDLGQQWTRAAELGASLFKFRLVLALGGAVVMLGALGGGAALALVDLRAGDFFGSNAMLGYGLAAAAIFFVGFPLNVVGTILDDFVVPLMVLRGARVLDAWRACRGEELGPNVGGVVLFYVLRVVLFVSLGVGALVLRCFTCCLSGLPYLSCVLLLPVFVAWRAMPLYYLEQLGLQIFPRPEPSYAAYDQWRFPQ